MEVREIELTKKYLIFIIGCLQDASETAMKYYEENVCAKEVATCYRLMKYFNTILNNEPSIS